MNCKEFEKRLNALLDERRELQWDSESADHLRACPRCRFLSAGYGAMLDGVEAIAVAIPSSVHSDPSEFSARVVRSADFAGPGHTIPALPPSNLRCTATIVMAMAAVLLVAVFTAVGLIGSHRHVESAAIHGSVANQISGDRKPPVDTIRTWPGEFVADGGAVLKDHQRIWMATGRNLAIIPVTIRRAADWSDSDGLADAVRPIVTSFNDTLVTLMRFLPGSASRAEVPNGDTSLNRPVSPLATV